MTFDLSDFYRVPIEDVLTPQVGRIVYPSSWWIITPDREVLFYNKHREHTSPQCNSNRLVAEHLARNYPDCTVEQLPVTFLKHNCSDYV